MRTVSENCYSTQSRERLTVQVIQRKQIDAKISKNQVLSSCFGPSVLSRVYFHFVRESSVSGKGNRERRRREVTTCFDCFNRFEQRRSIRSTGGNDSRNCVSKLFSFKQYLRSNPVERWDFETSVLCVPRSR